jgi:hypothetical protein
MGKNCNHHDCNVRPNFNYPEETIGLYCSKHKKPGMINVVNKLCNHSECNVLPSFNYPEETIGSYCSKHKKPGMINVVSKLCNHHDCNVQPVYNDPDKKSGLYCNIHKKPDMIDVTHKRCKHPSCNKRPNFNDPDKKSGLYCSKHKKSDMINVVDKRCKHPSCNKIPNFNDPEEMIGSYCSKHKKPGMINVVSKRCKHPSCNKYSIYNDPDKKSGLYCNDHKLLGMIDVTHKRCILCDLTRSEKKYDWYCFRCYIFKFPDKSVSRNYKVKEKHVTDYITQEFPDIDFTFDKLTGGCSKRRPDCYVDLGSHVLIVEIDENQHIDYDTTCEIQRINELYTDFADRPIIFIRFNPDSYTFNDKKIQSSFKYHRSSGVPIIRNQTEWDERLKILKETIILHMKTKPKKQITNINLYYDL